VRGMERTTSAVQARLLVSCPDRPGIIAAVTQFLFDRGANILDLDQHATSPAPSLFFLRLVLELEADGDALGQLVSDFKPLGDRFGMQWRLQRADARSKVAVFVSREDHCLTELLWRWRGGELPMDLAMVVSNHPDLEDRVTPHGVPFHHVPVTKDNKPQAFARQLELVEGQSDLVVLARYMQILPAEFCARFPHRIINIHHSFLPAFAGANPYAQAWERGVKLIGATAHYVTAELDAGPIIEQDVARVGHRHDVANLKEAGRDLERAVLARAVRWHLEDRVLVHGNKTIVFR
jgi:formyltetrahydrofolate deformylase